MIENLLDNATKYSPKGGEVVVRAERDGGQAGDWAVLSVCDKGVGIPAADLENVFQRFRRGGNVVGRIRGTGIGLAAVRQVVEHHGGSIEVESREGSGSTFTVRLPF